MFFKNRRDKDGEIIDLKNQVTRLIQENSALTQQLSVELNQRQQQTTSIFSSDNERLISRQVFKNMVMFSSFVADIQQSLLGVSKTLRSEKNNMFRLTETSNESRQSIDRISTAFVSIASDTAAMSSLVDRLNYIASDIHHIITDTKKSTQTKSMAGTITQVVELIESFQSETLNASKQTHSMVISTDNFIRIGVSAKEQLNEMISISSRMESVIKESALKSFVEVVKVDHLLWKLDVYKVFMGVSEKSPDEFADHTFCRLGQWYYQGEGYHNFSKLDGYAAIESPHKSVHQFGLSALRNLQNGSVLSSLKDLEKMEQASLDVLNALSYLADSISN